LKDFKSLVAEIQTVRCNWKEEVTKREALEIVCVSIKQGSSTVSIFLSFRHFFPYFFVLKKMINAAENERLTKLYTESLNSVGEEVGLSIYLFVFQNS